MIKSLISSLCRQSSERAPLLKIQLSEIATEQNFDEAAYLAANPDVRAAVASGNLKSGWDHFLAHGLNEGRNLRFSRSIKTLQDKKIERLRPLLRTDLTSTWDSGKPNFLSSDLKNKHGIVVTENVSENPYDPLIVDFIETNSAGLILDAGAGRRNVYYSNVVNYEIVDYDTTDVLGVGEELPFADNSFDGVISVAVLEHVKDPFRCAVEISRVLKSGGKLICCVPLLAPLHGYPNHYFNMTHQGLRALFEPYLKIERQDVIDSIHPVWALSWILRSWADGLPPPVRREFLNKKVEDLIGNPATMVNDRYARDLPVDKKFELACGTLLVGRKV